MKKSVISSAPYGQRTIIRPDQSRIVRYIFIGMYLAAGIVVINTETAVIARLGFIAILGFSMRSTIHSLYQHSLPASFVPGGHLLFEIEKNCWAEARIRQSLVCSWLIILKVEVRSSGKRMSLTYARDSIDPESFRRMKAYILGARC